MTDDTQTPGARGNNLAPRRILDRRGPEELLRMIEETREWLPQRNAGESPATWWDRVQRGVFGVKSELGRPATVLDFQVRQRSRVAVRLSSYAQLAAADTPKAAQQFPQLEIFTADGVAIRFARSSGTITITARSRSPETTYRLIDHPTLLAFGDLDNPDGHFCMEANFVPDEVIDYEAEARVSFTDDPALYAALHNVSILLVEADQLDVDDAGEMSDDVRPE